jgi:hypothetical protein
MPKCSAPGEIGPRRIDLVTRPLGIEAAPELDQRAAHQHLAQEHRVWRSAGYLDDAVVLRAVSGIVRSLPRRSVNDST